MTIDPKDTANKRELILEPGDINDENFSDWISINRSFAIRVISPGFTGTVTVQRRENEADTRIGDVDIFDAPTEEQGEAPVKSSMQYRIGVKASAVTAITTELYLALLR